VLHNIVDKIFVITTVASKRFGYIDNHLKSNGIKFEYVIAPETSFIDSSISVSGGFHKPNISLVSAYVSILENARISGYESVAVIEDDCFFAKNWEESLSLFLANLPNEWDILNLGYHPSQLATGVRIPVNEYVIRPSTDYFTTHCMVFKKRSFQPIIDAVHNSVYNKAIDHITIELYQNPEFNCFAPVKHFAYQLSVRQSPYYEIPEDPSRFPSLLFQYGL
jgi:hypothetical protein